MPSPRTITIGPYTFPITPGYSTLAEGFAVGPAELETLDYARSERVRKKAFKVFEKFRHQSGKRTLSEAELAHLTEQIARMDREVRLERYQTDPAIATSRAPRVSFELGGADDDDAVAAQGAFDEALARLAEARLAAEETTRGAKLPPSVRERALAALHSDPLLRDAARARVEEVLGERARIVEELF